jgi:hypothetical protein
VRSIVLSLYDKTGNMVLPWLEAGYECWVVDIQHPRGEHRDGNLVRVGADLRTWLPPRRHFVAAFCFSPCTHLSVSGARWFRAKGMAGLAEGLALFERGVEICEWTGAPYMAENPVSTISSYWRKPDHLFHPWEYAGYLSDIQADNYTKKTCLWTGNGFEMPEKRPAPPPHRNDIWLMPPSEARADLRSATPLGFSRAVYEIHATRMRAAA